MRDVQATNRTTLTAAEDSSAKAKGYLRPVAARALLVGVALLGAGVDVVTKIVAVATLDPADPPRLFGGLLRLRLIRNPGAAFSFAESATLVFSLFALAVLIFVVGFLLPRVAHRGWAIAFGLLTAGVLGNLGDRVFREPGFLRGHVVDFLQLPYWPVFNVADMCVTSAAILIMALSIFSHANLDGTVVATTSEPTESESATSDSAIEDDQ